jgi:hypothetical protein
MTRAGALEYLMTYHEFKYYLIVHSLDKLMDSYQTKKSPKEVKIFYDL